uniref:Uncharacterized protein n=1 Tax=Rhizophora mucronata TaxID=61149 RepID=A0A2P2LU21_RHIMU
MTNQIWNNPGIGLSITDNYRHRPVKFRFA